MHRVARAFRRASSPLAPLLYSLGANPAAEHPSYFVDVRLQHSVLLRINRARLFHQPHEKSKQVELHARSFENRRLVAALAVSGFKNALDHIKDRILAALVDGMSICFRHELAVLVKSPVQVVCLFEDRNVSVCHI